MNYYDLLEIQPTASDEVIKMAYKALVKKYHPDAYEGDKEYAEEMLQKINLAYEILSDKEKREQYDWEIKSPRGFDTKAESTTLQKDVKKAKTVKKKRSIVFWSGVFESLFSVGRFVAGIVVVYVIIGLITGNLKEWNENILYYSKVVVHFVNNINVPEKYETNSPEECMHQYIQAIFEGDEYEALKKIDASNEELNDMTVSIAKIFRQFQEDFLLESMFQDMKNAEYTIEHVRDQEYRVVVLTCDYNVVFNQADSDSYDDRSLEVQIEKKVRIAPKKCKKAVVLNMGIVEGQWYILDIPEKEMFIDALTGNFLGDTYNEISQRIG